MEFPETWKYLTKILAYPYEYFNTVNDCEKPVDKLRKENFFSKIKNECRDDEELERTKQIIKLFNLKNGKELTEIYIQKVMYFCLHVCLRNL